MAASPLPAVRTTQRRCAEDAGWALPEICVLVVHEHEVAQLGYRVILGGQPWVRRCLAASDTPLALGMADRYRPRVALIDAKIGDESGADLAPRLREISPTTRVLLTAHAAPLPAGVLRAAGAAGFVPANCSAAELVRAVAEVARGMTLLSSRRLRADGPLSERELAVLAAIGRGSTNREIAGELHISPHTVKQHTSALYRKLRTRNRAEAVQRGQRLGLLR